MTSETTLKCNNPSFVINTVPAHSITDGPIQCHDGRHDSVDLFDGFFFVRLDVPRRVLAHDDVAGHPLEDRIAAMDDVPFHQELEQLLRRRRHLLEPLAERHHGKAHVLEILHHLGGIPAVVGDFPDVVRPPPPGVR